MIVDPAGLAGETNEPETESQLARQLQIDGGLSVIGAGYEQPILDRVSLAIEAFAFGTYFLPWFDLGDDVKGMGAGLRPTWFARADGRGLYVTPYIRAMLVDDASITGADGFAISSGAFVGWAFGIGERLDLRVGGGVQYIYAKVDELSFGTPFVALDAVLGYRL
jgi:hypothetical protein